MTCQGRRHEPYWWLPPNKRCKGTVKRWRSSRWLLAHKTRSAVEVGRQCGQPANGKYGDFCYAHREQS